MKNVKMMRSREKSLKVTCKADAAAAAAGGRINIERVKKETKRRHEDKEAKRSVSETTDPAHPNKQINGQTLEICSTISFLHFGSCSRDR